MYAFPTNTTEVFDTVKNLKNEKAVGIGGVSAELLKTWLPVILLVLVIILKLFSHAVAPRSS